MSREVVDNVISGKGIEVNKTAFGEEESGERDVDVAKFRRGSAVRRWIESTKVERKDIVRRGP